MTAELLLVGGARPNFMKVAPIARAIDADGRLAMRLVHTGQHYDPEMTQLIFEDLGLPEPDVRLEVGSGSQARQTAEVMLALEPVIEGRPPAAVVVVGDVNSTLAATLVAVKLGVPVAHVEAGLRSFDRTMPEEINRVATDALSSWLFASEPSAVANLEREGASGAIELVGNVMIDTLLACRERAAARGAPRRYGLEPRSYAVLTLHRPANVDEPERLRAMLEPIVELAARMPVVFPVHPRTRAVLEAASPEAAGLRLVPPLGYLDFVGLLDSARLVLTDSGGIQEETTVLGVPCVTLRENTERPITLSSGTNRLGGVRPETIRTAVEEALAAESEPRAPELWDGRAAERIVDRLARDLEASR